MSRPGTRAEKTEKTRGLTSSSSRHKCFLLLAVEGVACCLSPQKVYHPMVYIQQLWPVSVGKVSWTHPLNFSFSSIRLLVIQCQRKTIVDFFEQHCMLGKAMEGTVRRRFCLELLLDGLFVAQLEQASWGFKVQKSDNELSKSCRDYQTKQNTGKSDGRC